MKARHTIRPTVPTTSTDSTRRRNSITVSAQPPTSSTQAAIAAGCAGSNARVPAAWARRGRRQAGEREAVSAKAR